MCTDVVPEWLPNVSGEEGPLTSVWPGRMDRALLSGDGKGRYCCADMRSCPGMGETSVVEQEGLDAQMREAREAGRRQSRMGLKNTERRFCLQWMSVTRGNHQHGICSCRKSCWGLLASGLDGAGEVEAGRLTGMCFSVHLSVCPSVHS